MSRTAFLAGILAAGAMAQTNFAVDGFEYVGCIEADLALFPAAITFVKAFTPQECQQSCAGKADFVAIGNGCHCSDVTDADEFVFREVEEEKCSTLCVAEDEQAGYCGGENVFNLYKVPDMAVDCEEEDANAAANVATSATDAQVVHSTVYKTVIDCAPEVTNCPGKIQAVVCPGAPECAELTAAPASVPTRNPAAKVQVDCPPEGCPAEDAVMTPAACPPGGCSDAVQAQAEAKTVDLENCHSEGCSDALVSPAIASTPAAYTSAADAVVATDNAMVNAPVTTPSTTYDSGSRDEAYSCSGESCSESEQPTVVVSGASQSHVGSLLSGLGAAAVVLAFGLA